MHKKLVTAMIVCLFVATTYVGITNVNRLEHLVDGVYDASPTPTTAPPSIDLGHCDPITCLRGVVTTYNAETHRCAGQQCWVTKTGAWWTRTAPESLRWVSASKEACKANPQWRCYYKDFGSFKKLVRPYYANLKVYAAAGPDLRKAISKAYGGFPSLWHKKPDVKVRFWQILPNGTIESHIIYIVDTCSCTRLADFSPGAWALFTKIPTGHGGWHHSLYAEVIPPQD